MPLLQSHYHTTTTQHNHIQCTQEIEAFVKADPYVENGLVPSYTIRPYMYVVCMAVLLCDDVDECFYLYNMFTLHFHSHTGLWHHDVVCYFAAAHDIVTKHIVFACTYHVYLVYYSSSNTSKKHIHTCASLMHRKGGDQEMSRWMHRQEEEGRGIVSGGGWEEAYAGR